VLQDRELAGAEARGGDGERFRAIVSAARDYAILTMTPDGIIDSWSPGAEAVFGWRPSEAIGQPVAMTFTIEDQERDVPAREMASAMQNGSTPDVRWHRRKDGSRVFIEGTARMLTDETGALRGFLKIGQDVTNRRSMEQALRESENRYRTLVENISDYAIFMLDPDGRIRDWTTGATRVLGYDLDEILGQHFSEFYLPAAVNSDEPERDLATAAANGRAERVGWRIRKNGERFYADELVTAVRDPDGELTGFTVITRDLTARRLAEENDQQLRAAVERDALRRQLLAAEETERRRFARELHDEAGQHLTALGLGLQALSDVVPPGSEIDRRAARLRTLVSSLSTELHGLAQRLRPRALDDLGLVPAISSFVDEFSRHAEIPVDMHTRLDGERLHPAVETAVYRIVQEALTNVARHSGATRASVIIERRDDVVVAIIEDNGRGFDISRPPRTGDRTPIGLRGMMERATLLGGVVEIESSPESGGTTLFVRIPCGES